MGQFIQIVSDDFNRPNQVGLGNSNWDQMSGFGNMPDIVSGGFGRLSGTASGNKGGAFWSGGAGPNAAAGPQFPSGQFCQATIVAVPHFGVDIFTNFRNSPSQQGVAATLLIGTDPTNYVLAKLVNGNYQLPVLVDTTTPMRAGDVVRVETVSPRVSASSITRVFVNGILIASATSAQAGGFPAISFEDDTATPPSSWLANFSAGVFEFTSTVQGVAQEDTWLGGDWR